MNVVVLDEEHNVVSALVTSDICQAGSLALSFSAAENKVFLCLPKKAQNIKLTQS